MIRVSLLVRDTQKYENLCEIDFLPREGETIEIQGILYDVSDIVHRLFSRETIVIVRPSSYSAKDDLSNYDKRYGERGL